MSLRHRLMETVAARRLWAPGERVAVAVSGGLDSTVLLDLLVVTAAHHRARLSVATVDHGVRPDSAEDAAFVAREAARRGLPCAVARLGLGPGVSEADCREGRYAALDALDVDRVALAHHRDDQVETALLGLLRGGGTRAVAGMPWTRGRYVRPLLDVGRDELRAWAGERGLAWRDDPTNASPDFLRNRVRAELVPRLDALRPGAARALARGVGHAAEDEAFLAQLAAAAPWDGEGWPIAFVADGPAPLVRRALLARLGDVTSAHLDAIVAAARRGRGRVRVDAVRSVLVDGSTVRIDR